ncbi:MULTISPECIES: histidine phosphatase family protein [Francisella]|uniref:Histidine-type phosphatase n=1 Tax=Francisella opportunistica TaxID=2016517 RepID=A0A345JP49_9GAMM|nr:MULTISPECIES: histidine phosphatase family protein [Francisella]APC90753.1 Major acid phosphatase Map [Francisella sp. MA067296]AXH29095.1 histidine-type phosphatase [Francisella opportunistica]AXH30748.1 histidine-type phosphatase [Francisella opportunistica]AXH32394.1 histidine-type phosphatase [Francisella opportunistica]
MKKICAAFTLLLVLIPFGYSQGKLMFVSMITRHGDRAPLANIKNSDYDWGAELSELTPIGMNQEYNLGSQLRKRYIEQFELLPENYLDNSIYVLSSNTNRTIVSAQSLLMGLYPPGTGPVLKDGKAAINGRFQPIPVMTLPADSRLIKFPYEQYLDILKKYIYNTPVWQNKTKEVQQNFKKWQKILGNKITGLNDIATIGDVLIVAKAHDKPLPEGLSQEDANKIIDLKDWGIVQKFKSQKVAYIMGAQLTNRMIEDLNNAASGKSKYKMTYYSGHDLTLLEVMGTLGVPLDKAPGYASNLQMELYKDSDVYTVKLRYNGKYVKLPIMDKDNSCTLDALNKYMQQINNKFQK